MHGKWVAIAAVNGVIAVAAGAFGAHALKDRLDLEHRLIFEVAARYHMYHALALLAVAWMVSLNPSRLARASGVCMVVGIVLFSGSLYGLSLGGMRWLGAVTPVGGSLFLAGWVLLAAAGMKSARSKSAGRPTPTSPDDV